MKGMKMKTEVVIVGGGPAGLAAGIELAKEGINTVLIEYHEHPRKKTCAGILTEKTHKLLADMISLDENPLVLSSCNVSLYFNKTYMYSFITEKPFLFVDRSSFDYELLKYYQKHGGNVLMPEKVVDIDFPQNRLRLSNGQNLSYKALIVADGINSPICKMMNLLDIEKGFCIQNSFPRIACPETASKLSGLCLEYGSIPFGYSWIVTNQDEIILGTGMMVSQFNWNSMLQEHEKLCSLFGVPKNSVRRGAFIPVGELRNQIHHPFENIVIIGDAAGFINPITGEGIYLALLSGKYAAKSYLTSPKTLRSAFLSLTKTISQTISEHKALLPEIYQTDFLKQFVYQFKEFPQYVSSVCDEIISSEKRSYSSFVSEVKSLLR